MTNTITIDHKPYREVSLETVQQMLSELHRYCAIHGTAEDSLDETVNASKTLAFSKKHEQSYRLQHHHSYHPTDTLLIPADCFGDPATAHHAWMRYPDLLTETRQDYLWLRAATQQIVSNRTDSKHRAPKSPNKLEQRIAAALTSTEIGRYWLDVQTGFNPTFLFTAVADEISGTYYLPNTIHHQHALRAPLQDIVSLRIHELAHRVQYAQFPALYLPDLSTADSFVAMRLCEASAYAEEAYFRASKLADWREGYVAPTTRPLEEHRNTFLATLHAPFMLSYEAEALNDDLYDLIRHGRIEYEVRHSPFLVPEFLARFCRPFPEEHGWFHGDTKELREHIIQGILTFQLPLLQKLHANAPRTNSRPKLLPQKLVA